MANRRDVPARGDRPRRVEDVRQAERACRQALQADPFDARALRTLGVICQDLGRLDEAASCFAEALKLRPDDAEACRSLGNALYLQGRPAEAAPCYQRALQLRPDDADAHNNLGAALADLGRHAEAVACYQSALRLRPDFADAHYNLGNTLRARRLYDEAASRYGHALRLRPDFAEAHNNLGIALHRQGRHAEAIASYRQALGLRSDYVQAHTGLGLTLAESGRLVEALACYEEALRLDPHSADAHRNRSLAWLLAGDLGRGFPEYEWRWRCADFDPPRFFQPRWDGSDLAGRTILLYTEQGAGDTLQFVRYAPRLRDRGGVVILAAPEPLHPILARCEGIDRLVPRAPASLPEFDVHCPLMSLPAAFGTTLAKIPAAVPYLRADPERARYWAAELATAHGFRVGIAWQGSPENPNDRSRSFPLRHFATLAGVEGVRLVGLQKGPGADQVRDLAGSFSVEDLGPRLDEGPAAFEDTAAVLVNLDLVVTCDTSLAHLAGGLGVPAWVALPAVPDWRWLLDREDSPWYPTLRLFRQARAGDWAEPFARMANALRAKVAAASGARSIAVAITPGELVDKMTILEIKARRITDPEKLRNVRSELEELAAVRDRALPPSAELDGLADELRAVNEAIWQVEDELRRCENTGDFGPRFVESARAVYRDNDRRAALKRRINDRLGCRRPEEKLYAHYEVRNGPIP